MKKRLLILPLLAMSLGACGEAPNPNPNPDPTPIHDEVTLIKIEVTAQPTKKEYKEGETFDTKGMEVTATMSDGSTKVVTDYQVSNQALTPNTTSIEILYQGKTATVTISVTALARYTVTFMASETEKIKDVVYKEGETPTYDYSVAPTVQYEYEFLGWSLTPNGDVLSELPKVTANATYYAKINQKTRKYSVIFKNENGQQVKLVEVEYGTKPVAPEYDPTDTAQYDYSLLGWSNSQGGEVLSEFPEVTGEQTYYAVVSSSLRSYTVKFINELGVEVQSSSINYGGQPSCDYEVEDTAEYDYTTKWSATQGGAPLESLPVVTENATYYAVVTKVKQKYDIHFKNEDGTNYKTIQVNYGDVPSISSPSKAKDQQYTYSFDGWAVTIGGEALASLPAVTGETTYYATFKGTLNKYTISLNLNCDEEDVDITADYGTTFDDFNKYVPEREGFHFAGWCSDEKCENKISFPLTLTDDVELYAKWNEKVDIKSYLTSLLGIIDQKPINYIPETLRTDYEDNLVDESYSLNFEETQSVTDIETVGFGAQWQMVLDNISQSEKFFWVTSASDSIVSATIAAFISYFESNPEATEKEETTETFVASCEYEKKVLSFSFTFNKSISIPFFGDLKPSIEMTYDVSTKTKTMKIVLNEFNSMKTSITDNEYLFGLSIGVDEDTIRTAYCQLDKLVNPQDESDVSYEGHIAEFITVKGVELPTKSMADFYIDSDYCTVVGTKVDKLIGSEAFINELYSVETGKYLGAMVEEHVEKELDLKIYKKMFTVTYHTFWFNLADIYGINSISAVSNGDLDPSNNDHDIKVNGSSKVFKVEHNKDPFIGTFNTSRQYDIEMKKHFYYYEDKEGKIQEKSTKIPMMFIQDDDTNYEDCEYDNTNLSDFNDNLKNVSKVTGGYLKTPEETLDKIRQDCLDYLPYFKEHQNLVNKDAILDWLNK